MNGIPFCIHWLRAACLVIVSLVTLGFVALISEAGPSEAQVPSGVTAATLFGPHGVAVDKNGNVYMADPAAYRVLEFPPTCASTGCSATRVFGQPDFTSMVYTGYNTTSAAILVSPAEVAVDDSGNVYIADRPADPQNLLAGRVLEFPSDCAATGCSATRVFGQTGFTQSATRLVDGGSHASASGLGSDVSGLAVDRSGNVYVADTENNRVLEFPADCAATGCSATRVFGQTSFSSNDHGYPITASNMCGPRGIAADGNGNVYVVDGCVVNRVLEFPANCAATGCSATRIFGETSFTGIPGTTDAAKLAPGVGATGVTVDSSGNVYIVDTGNNRVLEFPSSCAATGCSATRVFGQVDFAMISANQAHTALSVGTRPATTGANLDSPAEVAVDNNGNVYVTDPGNNRALEFPGDCAATGCAATRVYGKSDFAGLLTINTPPSPTNVPPAATSVTSPASDTAPPAPPDSTTAPTPSAPDSTALPDTLTDSMRADILAAVDRGNAAWTTAQQSLDPADLQSALTGQELRDDTSQIVQLQRAGQMKKPVNTAFAVLDVSLDSPTQSTVRTQETWSDAVYNLATGALIQQDPATNYSETYTVDLIDGQWTVSQIQLQ